MELLHYFPDLVSWTYAVNSFCIDPALLPVGTGEQEEIIDIQVDDTAKPKLKECSLIDFWQSEVLLTQRWPEMLLDSH